MTLSNQAMTEPTNDTASRIRQLEETIDYQLGELARRDRQIRDLRVENPHSWQAWIPVKGQIPAVFGTYPVIHSHSAGKSHMIRKQWYATFDPDDKLWHDISDFQNTTWSKVITHWLKLPAPPPVFPCDRCGGDGAKEREDGHVLCGQCQRDRGDCL